MKKVLAALFVVLFLTACSDKEVLDYEYSFTGESEHWIGEFYVQGTEVREKKNKSVTYTNDASDIFTLKYKGSVEDLSSVKTLEYVYETNTSSGSKNMAFNESPTEVVFTSRGRSIGAKVAEDEIIQVHVKWDDAVEIFELQNKGK